MNYESILEIVKSKADRLMELIPPSETMIEHPVATEGKYSDRRMDFLEPGQWTHSFLNGIVAYLYYHYKDKKYLDYLLMQEKKYTDLLYNNDKEISHDVGFMYSLYAVALYKLTGEVRFKKLALKAADEIGKRYQFRANVVQSFFDMRIRGITDEIAMIIVDDMMNMQLMMWAYRETGHSFYRSIYENHIENSVINLIRDDYSVCHAYNFDAKSGKPIAEENYCGFAIGSHWARGTSWMIYGLTAAILFTGNNSRYLGPLSGVVRKYINSLGSSLIPLWDFRLDEAEFKRLDTSAAAISASAFAEFGKINIQTDLKIRCNDLSDKVLDTLCENYLAPGHHENVLTHGQAGDEETGVIWGDYFFMELIMKKLYGDNHISFWL